VTPTEKDQVIKEMEETAKAAELLGLSEVTDWCSTGCTPLDLAIANKLPGGVPIGRVIQLFGGASTAKTVLATTILGYALRSGKQAYLADVEHTLVPTFARYYGLDCANPDFFCGYSFSDKKHDNDQPVTLEEFFDEWLAGILKSRSRKPKIVVVDSITALPSAIELKTSMTEQGFATSRAKAISLGLRKYLGEINRKNVTLICIDQTRDNVGGFGSSEVTNGGRGLEFYSSVRLYLKHDKDVVNTQKKEIGIWVKFKVDKNKVGPPFRRGHFKILFDYGLDDVTSMLSWLVGADPECKKDEEYLMTTSIALPVCSKCGCIQNEMSVACKSKNCDGFPELLAKRIMDWVAYIEENNQEINLRQYVSKVWKEEYATEERKVRVW